MRVTVGRAGKPTHSLCVLGATMSTRKPIANAPTSGLQRRHIIHCRLGLISNFSPGLSGLIVIESEVPKKGGFFAKIMRVSLTVVGSSLIQN